MFSLVLLFLYTLKATIRYTPRKKITEKSMDIKKIEKVLKQFSQERDWEQFHSPKNLSMALSVEASELVEIFQWLTEEQSYTLSDSKKQHTKEEVADIAIYLLRICMKLDIDLEEAILEKMKKNEEKYPVEKVKGSAKKYTEL
ncbi:nucleotide pyrophosphohydrolase [Aliarcobacter butzleri]|uniref:nucleotide pyrophosphohydrolase n=1 Tax=Aliarcobacter butzleri TaxID=28197 RepID=UPI003B20BF7C